MTPEIKPPTEKISEEPQSHNKIDTNQEGKKKYVKMKFKSEGFLDDGKSNTIANDSLDLNQFGNLSESHKKELMQIYAEASKRVKQIILTELTNKTNSININTDDNKDPYLLVIQQKIIDLQKKEIMAPKKKGGVILPSDKEHSGTTDNMEYTNNEIAEN